MKMVMGNSGSSEFAEHIHVLNDPKTGLKGVIVLHSTTLGPAAGGCAQPDRAGDASPGHGLGHDFGGWPLFLNPPGGRHEFGQRGGRIPSVSGAVGRAPRGRSAGRWAGYLPG